MAALYYPVVLPPFHATEKNSGHRGRTPLITSSTLQSERGLIPSSSKNHCVTLLLFK